MRVCCAVAALAWIVAGASAADPPVRQGNIIGKWTAPSSTWATGWMLELRADRIALLQIALLKEAEPQPVPPPAGKNRNGNSNAGSGKLNGKPASPATPEIRQGSFNVRRGVWGLTLRDVNDREYYYTIVSIDAHRFQLIDTKGKKIEFARAK